MLRDMSDVVQFYHEMKSKWGDYNVPIIMERSYEYKFFIEGMNFPKSYSDFVERFEVEGVFIGALVLTPYPNMDLAENLIKLNSIEKNPLIPHDMFHIADFEGDLILMGAMGNSHYADGVYYIDISTGNFSIPEKIVDNFEDFIILASNIHSINIEGSDDNAKEISDVITENFHKLSDSEIKIWEKMSVI
ncbi:hypothetical protein [Algihabitans sp.]|uniref:hypothetical protein n=1 Tax=Algihabitans sp. TaxID=2821514 RepID=UPI003BAC1633